MKSSSERESFDGNKEEIQAKKIKISSNYSLINQYILDDKTREDLSRAFRFVPLWVCIKTRF